MKYMDRRLIFSLVPLTAVTASAQQPSPEAAAAETALRARVSEFFQDQVDKKYRQAEALVAEDTKDLYYGGNKFNIKSFTITRIELTDNNTKAKVSLKAGVTVILPAGGPVSLEAPQETLWKLEGGEWRWYVPTENVPTPFGAIKAPSGPGAAPPAGREGKAPDLATLQSMVKLDRSLVTLDDAPQTVTLSNTLDGPIDISIRDEMTRGFRIKIVDRNHLEAGDKAIIQLTPDGKGPQVGLAHIEVSPLPIVLEIRVVRK